MPIIREPANTIIDLILKVIRREYKKLGCVCLEAQASNAVDNTIYDYILYILYIYKIYNLKRNARCVR